MADAMEAPEETQDTPAESAPDDGTRAETVDWEKRYNDLRPQYDRSNQELAELKALRESLADPGRQAEILREFGIELADDEPPSEEPEEDDIFRDPRVDRLIAEREQEKQQRQQEKAYEAFVEDFTDQVEAIEKTDGRELTEREIKILYDRAEATLYRGEQPRIEDLYADLKALRGDVESEIIESKKAPRVQAGRSASKQPDLDNEQERQEHMIRRMFGNQNT